ncbi:hypothetical protein [Reyranella sp.]|uniref:hypothetical protein n=1 Tax=Reyranella sp. TaxID=1929291 RepID=UPI001214228D|nr:hypothetical protein [Reyranella sp.]TAJ89247.1 MAG: hypothetical protein EPO50_02425 [Reyranella sp.]
MNWQDTALVLAGIIGSTVAVIHGVLVQRYMVRPVGAFLQAEKRAAASTRRLVPLLLHFSTVSWFVGGLALIAAAGWFGAEARLATSLIVGGLYLYGALGNLWGTRGRHPGWMLYSVALILIAFGAIR